MSRTFTFAALALLGALALTGCPSSNTYQDDVATLPDAADVTPDIPDVHIDLPPCLADADCPLGSYCDLKANACVECRTTADCDAGHICREGACEPRPGCADNGACPEGVCDLTTGLCVECLLDEHCPEGFACIAHFCEPVQVPCEDGACPPPLVCDPDTGRCVECLDDAACAPTGVCKGQTCVPTVCTPGARACAGGTVMRCADDGTAWLVNYACPEGQRCDDGICVDACVPDCQGRECGPDGCEGTCGTCGDLLTCDAGGRCLGDFGYPCAEDIECASGFCVPGPGDQRVCTVLCEGPCPAPDWHCAAIGDMRPDETFVCLYDPGCQPECDNRACGPDRCGGVCGLCDDGWHCTNAGACAPDQPQQSCPQAWECLLGCDPDLGTEGCLEACAGDLLPAAVEPYRMLGRCVVEFCAIVDQGWPACAKQAVESGTCGKEHALCVECQPPCAFQECGFDACGNACGECPAGLSCSDWGRCVPVCEPSCVLPNGKLKECGPDGCGGQCGSCQGNQSCVDGRCEGTCVPQCTFPDGSKRECGPNGCGGVCGICDADEICQQGRCKPACTPQCVGKQCGPNGCGGVCGSCPAGTTCNDAGFCQTVCVGSCQGRECGGNGCGGTCGLCPPGEVCEAGQCVRPASCNEYYDCVLDCALTGMMPDPMQCADLCGVDFGTPAGQDLMAIFNCVVGECGFAYDFACIQGAMLGACNDVYLKCVDCQPQCTGKECGPDGCGGACGWCPPDMGCADAGFCEPVCFPQCTTSSGLARECGGDGCGGVCGVCAPDEVCSGGLCKPGCVPSCQGKQCGSDGCGGSCGACKPGDDCVQGKCVTVCQPSCVGPNGQVKECGGDGCGGSCGLCPPGESCANGLCQGGCLPQCVGPDGWPRECGPDGCGGSCGACLPGEQCNSQGQCVGSCLPQCVTADGINLVCGPDGCGGLCGVCPTGLACVKGQCTGACVPQCAGKACGSDGCGGFCGVCPSGTYCDTAWQCRPLCEPSCQGRECGPDGCGGSCGACGADERCEKGQCQPFISCYDLIECMYGCENWTDETCYAGCWDAASPEAQLQFQEYQWCLIEVCGYEGSDQCYEQAFYNECKEVYYACLDCTPNCQGKQCGPDGCGGQCGTCQGNLPCDPFGQCPCQPYCYGRECGPDGCGGSCGTCSPGLSCSSGGDCVCLPACKGLDGSYKECGPDGCGGSCGACPQGMTCGPKGMCEGGCVPQCWLPDGTYKECGADGCGGSCGTCAPGQSCVSGHCQGGCQPLCVGRQCGPDGCGGSCGKCQPEQVCTTAGKCQDLCTPKCTGRECGADGCGGACGTCAWDEACVQGQCVPFVSCEDILTCIWACADGDKACNDACFAAASPAAKTQWFDLWLCLTNTCGTPPSDGCVGTALVGACKGEYYACLSCTPNCQGKQCGPDGCGGQCGGCPAGVPCDEGTGLCACQPKCTNKQCGSDGCGGSCGTCPASQACSATGKCVCVPRCEGRECGTDGCGGSCGTCPGGSSCEAGVCQAQCDPSCDQMECGYDCMGQWCGDCPEGLACMPWGFCEPVEPDGCSFHEYPGCGGCSCEKTVCQQDPYCCDVMWDDICVEMCWQVGGCGGGCEPSCDQLECGYDCQGQYCGSCPPGLTCQEGRCFPDGDDQGCYVHDWPGCGGCSCEEKVCAQNPFCCFGFWHEGCVQMCQDAGGCGGCQPSCWGKQCGDDGCGGSCGYCPPGTQCNAQGFCQQWCQPNCFGKQCGPDGCGGQCGTCPAGTTCSGQGLCQGQPGKTCMDIVTCALGTCLGSTIPDLTCFQTCMNGASQSERQQFQALFQCVLPYCLSNPTAECLFQAAETQCAAEWKQCQL